MVAHENEVLRTSVADLASQSPRTVLEAMQKVAAFRRLGDLARNRERETAVRVRP